MGFLPLRDNRPSWYRIYAHSEAASVAKFIDRLHQPAAQSFQNQAHAAEQRVRGALQSPDH